MPIAILLLLAVQPAPPTAIRVPRAVPAQPPAPVATIPNGGRIVTLPKGYHCDYRAITRAENGNITDNRAGAFMLAGTSDGGFTTDFFQDTRVYHFTEKAGGWLEMPGGPQVGLSPSNPFLFTWPKPPRINKLSRVFEAESYYKDEKTGVRKTIYAGNCTGAF